MRVILWVMFGGMLIKLSCDDLKSHRVYERDLQVLCGCGLLLFEVKTSEEWALMIFVCVILILCGSLRHTLGSGDLSVIVTQALTMDLREFLLSLHLAALLALLMFISTQKAAHDELPFVPFLSTGMFIIYLIRLRLIFS